MKIVAPGAQAQLAYQHAREEITREVRARHQRTLDLAPPEIKRAIEGKIKKEIREELSKRFPYGGLLRDLTGDRATRTIE
ncbi:MAG: hypothetical protein IT577_10125 [Verrucomicrobiae bacterium]|nr:hypothetical protein [Verrucomicrobiae bacterium]